jgi:hypothetical protein
MSLKVILTKKRPYTCDIVLSTHLVKESRSSIRYEALLMPERPRDVLECVTKPRGSETLRWLLIHSLRLVEIATQSMGVHLTRRGRFQKVLSWLGRCVDGTASVELLDNRWGWEYLDMGGVYVSARPLTIQILVWSDWSQSELAGGTTRSSALMECDSFAQRGSLGSAWGLCCCELTHTLQCVIVAILLLDYCIWLY